MQGFEDARRLARCRSDARVGEGLAEEFGWKVGDTVPIIGAIFPRPGDEAWPFEVAGIYRPTRAGFDDRTLFFHWEYFSQTQLETTGEEPMVGTFVVELEPGADATPVMSSIDALFDQGPQRVQATTEAEFQRQFVSMIGNLPRFLGSLGGGVLVAILLACVNTMLMTAREQVHDVGVLKALGFRDGTVFGFLMTQSLVLCAVGGGLGVLAAVALQDGMAAMLVQGGQGVAGYRVKTETAVFGLVLSVLVGVLAGLVPAVRASRQSPVEALRATV